MIRIPHKHQMYAEATVANRVGPLRHAPAAHELQGGVRVHSVGHSLSPAAVLSVDYSNLTHLAGLRPGPFSSFHCSDGLLPTALHRRRERCLPHGFRRRLYTCGGPGGAREIRCPASVANLHLRQHFERQFSNAAEAHSSIAFRGGCFDADHSTRRHPVNVQEVSGDRQNV